MTEEKRMYSLMEYLDTQDFKCWEEYKHVKGPQVFLASIDDTSIDDTVCDKILEFGFYITSVSAGAPGSGHFGLTLGIGKIEKESEKQ